jgi:hypothetical protein
MACAIVVSTLLVDQGVNLHRLMRTRASRDTSPRSMSPFTNMQPEHSTSAPEVDALPPVTEQRTSEQIQIAVSAL